MLIGLVRQDYVQTWRTFGAPSHFLLFK